MTRLERACRMAVTWAPRWGTDWALNHIAIALIGDGDSATWERGLKINRRAYLGSRLVQLRERIPELEKEARKTPPRTDAKRVKAVESAKTSLEAARAERDATEREYARLVASLKEGGENG